MKIPEYRNLIRQDFMDTVPTAFTFDDSSVDRAIQSAVEDLSRWVSNELFYEFEIDTLVYTETFSSTGITTNSVIQLSRKCLRFGTLIIVYSGTTYKNKIDYEIDYTNGKLTFPTGSAIIALADSLTLTVTYELSRTMFDLSSFTDLRDVRSVELTNNSLRPIDPEPFELIGKFLQRSSGIEIVSGYHVIIRYDARQTPPDDNDDGSVPEFLSEAIIKGAEAQLLFALAISLEIAQSTNVDLLTDLASYFTLLLNDLVSGRAQLALATTQMGVAVTQAAATITAVAADITAATSHLTDSETAITAAIADLVAGLATIDTEVANDLSSAATYLTDEDTQLAQAIADLAAGLTKIDTEVESDLTAMGANLTAVETAITGATTNIVAGLALVDTEVGAIITNSSAEIAAADILTGNAATTLAIAIALTANSVLIGKDPIGDIVKESDNILAQAAAKLKSSEDYMGIVKGQLDYLGGYISAADEYIKEANTRVNEASANIEAAKVRLALNSSYITTAEGYIKVSDTRNAQAIAAIESAKVRVEINNSYVNTVNGYLKAVDSRTNLASIAIENAKVRISLLQALTDIAGSFRSGYVNIAQQYDTSAGVIAQAIQDRIAMAAETRQQGDSVLQIAEKLRAEATRRYTDYFTIISDRNQTRRSIGTVARRQPS